MLLQNRFKLKFSFWKNTRAQLDEFWDFKNFQIKWVLVLSEVYNNKLNLSYGLPEKKFTTTAKVFSVSISISFLEYLAAWKHLFQNVAKHSISESYGTRSYMSSDLSGIHERYFELRGHNTIFKF